VGQVTKLEIVQHVPEESSRALLHLKGLHIIAVPSTRELGVEVTIGVLQLGLRNSKVESPTFKVMLVIAMQSLSTL